MDKLCILIPDSWYWNMSWSCFVVSSNNNGFELREVHCSLNSQSQGGKMFLCFEEFSKKFKLLQLRSCHRPWGSCQSWRRPRTGNFLRISLLWREQCAHSEPERGLIWNICVAWKKLNATFLLGSQLVISCRIIYRYLEFVPLLAKVDAHIWSGNRQVRTTAVEAEIPHLRQEECVMILFKAGKICNLIRLDAALPHSPHPAGGSWSSSISSNPRVSHSCHQQQWLGSNLGRKV